MFVKGIGRNLYNSFAFGGLEIGEAFIKSGKGFGELISDVGKGGFVNGNFSNGLKYAKSAIHPAGLAIGGIFGIMSAFDAPRGKAITHGFSTMTSVVLSDIIGGALGGPGGAMLAQSTIQPILQAAIEKPLDAFAGLHQNVTRMKMGGDYEDTEVAYTMRQRAAQEMGRSLLNARRYLGSEAAMFHQ